MIETQGLPNELLKELKLKTKVSATQKAAESALKGSEPMDLNEIIVAMWKETDHVFKRSAVASALNTMIKKGKVERTGYGRYTLVNQEQGDSPVADQSGGGIEPNFCEFCEDQIEGRTLHYDGKTFCGNSCKKAYIDEVGD